MNDLVGMEAVVIVRVPGDSHPGSVVVHQFGGTETYLAYSEQECAVGERVYVVDYTHPRTVTVLPVDPPIA